MALSFPNDLLEARAHFCKIDALAPVQTAGRIDRARGADGVELNRRVVSSIYLPIPINLTQGVQEHEIDTKANLLGLMGDSLQTAAITANRFLAGVNRSVNVGHYIIYQAPQFKIIDYTWTMMPRNRQESEAIRNIVYWLGYYSSPSSVSLSQQETQNIEGNLNAAGTILGTAESAFNLATFEYPNEFRISYLYADEERQKVQIFNPPPKTGFISKLEVNYYDEEGSPTAFFTNTEHPTVTTINFTMQENELTVRSDYSRQRDYLGGAVDRAEELEEVHSIQLIDKRPPLLGKR